MADTINCPYCNMVNEERDKFCINCGRPLKGEVTLVLPGEDKAKNELAKIGINQEQNGTAPLLKENDFLPRPLKAIFGDRFLGNRLVYSAEGQHGYLVTEVAEESGNQIKECTNPECGAVHGSLNDESEKYCTTCSAPLSNIQLTLALFEANKPIYGNASWVSELGLTHAGIRAPLVVFQEKVCGKERFCLVKPYTETIVDSIERDQVFRWGMTLASAFGYLHQNGLTYNGQFGEEIFNLSKGNAVIANLGNLQIVEEAGETVRIADFKSLASVLFQWLTGQKQYNQASELPPALNHFFDAALGAPGFPTAEAFIQAFAESQQLVSDSRPIEHKLGRKTDVGIVRSLNEDSLLTIQVDKFLASLHHPIGIYVVADGMGGHSAGEVASGTIITTIAENSFSNLISVMEVWSPEECCKWIDQVVQKANKAVYDLRRKMDSDMGSTIVMALAAGNSVCLGHVGDSRAYQINRNGMTQLTTDHSLVERLVDTGQITREEARNHPQRNVIYRTIGDKEKVEVETRFDNMNRGDRLLLCSDGLNGMLEDELIREIVMEVGISPQDACEELVHAAKEAGGDDNITVVIIEFS